MNETKFLKTKKIVQIIAGVVLFASLLGWLFLRSEDDIFLTYHVKEPVSLEWVNAETDELCGDSALHIARGEAVLIKAELPTSIYPDGAINYYDLGFHVKVIIDGEVIYEAGADGNLTYGYETGSLWRSIPIKQWYCRKTIYIKFENLSHSDLEIYPSQIQLGQQNDVLNMLIKDEGVTIIEVGSLLLIAVLFLAFAVVLFLSNNRHHALMVGSLSLLSICVALWILFDGHLAQFFTHSGTTRYGFAYISFALIPLFSGGYFKYMLDKGKKVVSIALMVYEIILAIAFGISMLRIVHISHMLFFIQGFMILLTCFALVSSIINYRDYRDWSHRGVVIAICMLMALSMFGAYQYYAFQRSKITLYMGAGYIAFLVVLSLTQLSNVVRRFGGDVKIKNFRELARVDAVTGGNSRIVAGEWLEHAKISDYESVWMVHMDLMHFSSVNAVVGWTEGDAILRDIYKSNLQYLRSTDMQCNVGNAEFIFILINRDSIDDFCNNLTENLKEYLNTKRDGLLLNVEYAAIQIKQGDEIDPLLDSVQMAYHNPLADFKPQSNCYYFNEKCREKAKRDLELETRVPTALENEEFLVYVQPKVNPRSRKVEGGEALVRWNTPGGMIPPAEFIPLLEKSGLIRKVDLYVFRKICEYLADREKKGLEQIPISVNVSKYGIEEPKFFDAYKAIMDETKVPAQYIEFELTESIAFDDIRAIERLTRKMHKCGAKVAMDDFGSAYSNLGVIARLNFDIVKLDKQFFDNGFPNKEADYALVRGLIQMFHAMNLSIVCEGVENEDQSNALRYMDADMIQGFYFAKPMPVEAFSTWSIADVQDE